MISVKNLTKTYRSPIKKNFISDLFFREYKNIKALNHVSFEIGDSELVGFIGPNGAGKTTTMKILAGILYPTSGQVSVLGFTPFEKDKEFLKQISFVMGSRNQLIWDLPATDTFLLNKEVYNIPEKGYKKMIDELSGLLNCKDLLSKPVKILSLGERMKMELIAALLHRPKLVFFDEPTIGLDIFSQETIRDFIRKYQKEFGSTVILTSHYMEDVKSLAKRLLIINKGKIIYDGSLSKILEEYSHQKKVSVVLDKPVNETEIRAVGEPLDSTSTHITYMIDKIDLPEKVKLITKSLPFSDLTVEDETIEEIIKNFFKEET
jgi:ABC-2 type transport system ATP-binding protein